MAAVCGHILIPLILASITKEVYCPRCGDWRKIRPGKPTAAEIAGVQIEIPDFPEKPPF